MTSGFVSVPEADKLVLGNARISSHFISGETTHLVIDDDELVSVDLIIRGGLIAEIVPAGTAKQEDHAVVDLQGGQVWPGFVDLHTHLDKGHIWPRAENPDGSFMGALMAVKDDRQANWSRDDVQTRMDFGLRCSFAHGTAAIRTHLDSQHPQHLTSWSLFTEMRKQWAGRIDLQATSIIILDDLAGKHGDNLADMIAESGGILGAVTHMVEDLGKPLERAFQLAEERGLDLDFHVDESGDAADQSLGAIAEMALERGFKGNIVAGHCCSLAVQPDEVIERTLAMVKEAGITVVSLPMCNMYLQDRNPGRTPRWRGVTLLHEMRALGIPVAVASDNCRDPFYGYGDHDILEVFTQAARIAHLDRPVGNWCQTVTSTPADVMRLKNVGRIQQGAAADLVLFSSRGWCELLSRPQADRVVLRSGHSISTALPDYRELDHLFTAQPKQILAEQIA